MEISSPTSPELLAKSDPEIWLTDHSISVGATASQIIESPAVARLLETLEVDISLSRLVHLTKQTGWLHDPGKAHPAWQQGVLSGRTPPHSARSALYALCALRQDQETYSYEESLAIVLAILHHHTPFTEDHMRPSTITAGLHPDSEMDSMTAALAAEGFPAVTIESTHVETLQTQLKLVRKDKLSESESESVGRLATLIRSALIQADHYVSAGENGEAISIPHHLTADDISLYDRLRPYQRQVAHIRDRHVVGVAGCGEGKTGGAMAWAHQQVTDGAIDRLVFAMPTQVTTNNLLLSLTGGTDKDSQVLEHVPPSQAGLYHSAADAFYESTIPDERWDTSAPMLRERAREWFQKPVTVTTVDHVLRTLVNGYDGSTIARANLLRAGIVFDELHAYDTHLTKNILGALEALDDLDVPWFVMTATLPPAIRDHRVFDGASEVISTGQLQHDQPPREPFTVYLEETDLTAEEAIQAAEEQSASRVMVVKNTVPGARSVNQELRARGYESIYYSSAFIAAHQQRKETEIRTAFSNDAFQDDGSQQFLVCTPICELSLDLSADLLLTDVAPMDAILQRAGRLHRSGVKPTARACRDSTGCSQCAGREDLTYECRVYAPLAEQTAWYPYTASRETEMWTLLERTAAVCEENAIYRFDRSMEWIADAYAEYDGSLQGTIMNEAINEDCLLGWKRNLSDSASGPSKLELRDISSYRFDVLAARYTGPDGTSWSPSERWKSEHTCSGPSCGLQSDTVTECDRALQTFRRQYSVSIPTWWKSDGKVSLSPFEVDGNHLGGTQVASVSYEYETGITPIE